MELYYAISDLALDDLESSEVIAVLTPSKDKHVAIVDVLAMESLRDTRQFVWLGDEMPRSE